MNLYRKYRKFVMMTIAIAAVLSLAATGPASAATYTVTRLSDGPTAATTRGTLRWAITQAELDQLPDTITFKTQGTIVLSSPLPWISSPITINGPGIVISGNNANAIFGVGENADSSAFGNLTLSRLTLKKGVYFGGGAVSCQGGSVTATNCTFNENGAQVGGAIYFDSSGSVAGSLTLAGCTFTGNTASMAGGAVAAVAGEFSATDCTFKRNSCVASPSDTQFVGGGALLYIAPLPNNPLFTQPALVHCTFTGNTASSASSPAFGGAIVGLWVNATRCTFRNNVAISTAEGAFSTGGAIAAIDSALVTDCAFARNQAGDLASDPNLFPSYGGAITTSVLGSYGQAFVEAVNCSFGANSAGYGSAVRSDYIGLANCIVWGNPSLTGNQLFAYAGEVSFSDVQLPGGAVFEGTGNINANPRWLLNPQQGDQDNTAGVLQLLEGSPCIDAGANEAAQSFGLTVDLLGRNRFINDRATLDTGSGDPPIVDMGAYEYRP